MSQDNVKLRLSVKDAGAVARVVELECSPQGKLKVGQLKSSDLHLDHPSISSIHANIESDAGQLYLVDFGSVAGTMINGQKVTTREPIQSGDVLTFGEVEVVLEIGASASASAPAAPAAGLGKPSAGLGAGGLGKPSAGLGAGGGLSGSTNSLLSALGGAPKQEDTPARASASASSTSSWREQQRHEQQRKKVTSITTPDGEVVAPYTLQGYYDDRGNYIPGYYDDEGEYHLGYGFYNDAGEWEVTFGYYDPAGEWVETAEAVAEVDPWSGFSDRDHYTEVFFETVGGDTLEVAMVWSDIVLSMNSYRTPRNITIGSERTNDFVMEHESLTGASWPVIRYQGSYALMVTSEMDGLISEDGKRYTLREAIQQGIARADTTAASRPGATTYIVPLNARTAARVDLGDVSILAHFTDQPALVGMPVSMDLAVAPYLTFSAIAHITFIILALTMPADPAGMELDSFKDSNRFVQLMITPDEEEKKEDKSKKPKDEDESARVAKHSGEEGRAGKQGAEQTNAKLAIKGPSDNANIQIKKAYDTQVATNAFNETFNSGELTSVLGNAESSLGSDVTHALGNLDGTGAAGVSGGMGGLGLANAGRGGGGDIDGSLGADAIGTRGVGGGGYGNGRNYGKHAVKLEKKYKDPKIVPLPPQVMGSLDKKIIQRVVRQHRNEIRFCYEKELQKNPKLAGEVKVQFTITGSGSVSVALVKGSTLKNAAVEQCLAGKIRRWVFPAPTNNGIVIVNYPFRFST